MSKPFTRNDPRINRRGRPRKGQGLTDILSIRLDGKDETGILKRQVIVDRLIKAAMDGDVAALRYIFDRIDGKPTERIEQVQNTISDETREKLKSIFTCESHNLRQFYREKHPYA
jgi:hypothetical protein